MVCAENKLLVSFAHGMNRKLFFPAFAQSWGKFFFALDLNGRKLVENIYCLELLNFSLVQSCYRPSTDGGTQMNTNTKSHTNRSIPQVQFLVLYDSYALVGISVVVVFVEWHSAFPTESSVCIGECF